MEGVSNLSWTTISLTAFYLWFNMNVDWFKPFKHSEYKVGAIYLSVMNLPDELGFKQENILTVGLIPGLHELQDFLIGIPLSVHSCSVPQVVRCALLCVACDIPACRKVSGFMGHSAVLGCSRCLKQFPQGKDFSGFDRSNWPSRTVSQC